jgi:hypothetical protein
VTVKDTAYGCGSAPEFDRLPLFVADAVVWRTLPRGRPSSQRRTLPRMSWTWTYAGADGATASTAEPAPAFPSQSDAESWLGETWRELLEAGVESVTLREDEREVYGPMSLRPTG